MAVQDIRLLPHVLEQYSIGFKDAYKRSITRVAKAGLRTAVNGTPVDTGRAVNNWVTSLDRPFAGYINTGAYLPPPAVVAAGSRIIDAIDTKKDQSVVYIVNNAPYIERLNNGYSKKKPSGFIEKAMQAMFAESKTVKFLKRGR